MGAEVIVTDAQLNAWLTFFGGIIVAGLGLIAALANRTRQHAKASRNQVENDHSTNLREEQDTRHRESMAAIRELRTHVDRRFDATGSDIRGLRRDIGRLTDSDEHLEERIRDLENTQPRWRPKEE